MADLVNAFWGYWNAGYLKRTREELEIQEFQLEKSLGVLYNEREQYSRELHVCLGMRDMQGAQDLSIQLSQLDESIHFTRVSYQAVRQMGTGIESAARMSELVAVVDQASFVLKRLGSATDTQAKIALMRERMGQASQQASGLAGVSAGGEDKIAAGAARILAEASAMHNVSGVPAIPSGGVAQPTATVQERIPVMVGGAPAQDPLEVAMREIQDRLDKLKTPPP